MSIEYAKAREISLAQAVIFFLPREQKFMICGEKDRTQENDDHVVAWWLTCNDLESKAMYNYLYILLEFLCLFEKKKFHIWRNENCIYIYHILTFLLMWQRKTISR